MDRGAANEPAVSQVKEKRPKASVRARRTFLPQFKVEVLDSYYQDFDSHGRRNQRATARKYKIHRRQIQKWLKVESSLRLAVQQAAAGTPKPSKIAVAAAIVETTSDSDSDVNVDDISDTEDAALDLSIPFPDFTKRKRADEELNARKLRSFVPIGSAERPLYACSPISPIGYPYVDYPMYYCWPSCSYCSSYYVKRPVTQGLTYSLDQKVLFEQEEPSLLDISYPHLWNKQDYRLPSSV